MITHEHQAVLLFGIPLFTIVLTAAVLTAVAGGVIGLARCRKPYGKVVFAVAAILLSVLVAAAILVLITVAMGTMG